MNAITRPTQTRLPYPEAVVLWQGGVHPVSAAIRIWHVRAVAIWFLLLLADGATMRWRGPFTQQQVLIDEAKLLVIGMAATALLIGLAWLTARTTLYTVTDRCVIMRYGLALQARLVIPFAAIEHIGIRVHPDQTGDIALRLKLDQEVPYHSLWPHARPWRFLRAEPTLRTIPEPGVVGTILARAVASRHRERDARIAALATPALPRANHETIYGQISTVEAPMGATSTP